MTILIAHFLPRNLISAIVFIRRRRLLMYLSV
ncbi:MAG: hypothetical protein HQ517_17015 [SAR324 cluster bacterium]|nr:hypothetical protein [SAR324 cluster bacterium]